MHEGDRPPAPLRFRRTTWCRLVMAHNHWVGDISAVQTTPPCEIHLAADIQNVHKMIADEVAATALTLHRFFLLDEDRTIFGESGPAGLRGHSCRA